MAPPQSLSAAISHVLVIFALILPEAYAGGTVSLTKAPAFFYRATLCAGLHQLWRILASQLSRWKQWSTRDPEWPLKMMVVLVRAALVLSGADLLWT
jgi:hypothetical protein